jgi:archaellum component FlaG (FlaF/FlaG flagellin family)
MRIKKRYMLGVAAAAVAVAVGAGVAVAYWTDSGSGSSTATTGTSTNFQVTVTPTAGNAALTPGGPTDAYTFTVKNNGTGNQNVSAVTVTVANSDGTTWTSVAGCSAADYQISGATVTGADLAAGASTTGSFSVQMKDGAGNQNGCKGATVPLYVSVS